MSEQAKFWNQVYIKSEDECWEWKGARHAKGYGMARWNGKGSGAHRVAYELKNNISPKGLCVCHSCDSPPCCNPKHLFLGTIPENNQDRDNKNRKAIGINAGCGKLTKKQVQEIISDSRPCPRIAEAHGISNSYVHALKKGIWRKSLSLEVA